MNTDINQKIASMDVHDIAKNLGYRTTDRSDATAFNLAMKVIVQLLRDCSVTDLTKEQCADPLFLKTLCTQLSSRRATALATGVPLEKISHLEVKILVCKLANLIWSLEFPMLAYPVVHPDQTSRATFREAIIAQLSSFPLNRKMGECTTHFIANLLDRQHLSNLQSVLINRLQTHNGIEMLLARQPGLMDCLHTELKTVFTGLPDTLMLTNFHSLWFVDSEGNSVSDQSLASLVLQSLTSSSSEKPRYRPLEIRYKTQLSPLHDQFLSITEPQFMAFCERIKHLNTTYIECVKRYWSSPTDTRGKAPTKEQSYVDHYRLLLETQLQLLCADGSLDRDDDTAIRTLVFQASDAGQAPSLPSHKLRAVRMAIRNGATLKPRRCSFAVAFQVKPRAAAALPTTYVYTPHNGFEVFTNAQQTRTALNRQLNNRQTLPAWVQHVALEHKAETAFFSQDVPKTIKVEPLRQNVVQALIAYQLEQTYQDINTVFAQYRSLQHTPQATQLSAALDQVTRRTAEPTTGVFLNARAYRVIERMPNNAVAQAFFLQQEPGMELPLHRPLPATDIANVLEPAPELLTLITDAQFKTFASNLLATPDHKALLRRVLNEGLDPIPDSVPITAEVGLRLVHKYINHTQAAPRVDSLNHRVIIAAQQAARVKKFFTRNYHYLTACFLVLGEAPGTDAPHGKTRASPGAGLGDSAPSSTLDIHAYISGGERRPDINALTAFLDVQTYLPDLRVPDTGLHPDTTMTTLMNIVVDSPVFHRLERAAVDTSSWTPQEREVATPGMIRALALSCITNYVCPPEHHSEGYVCGLNLNTPAMGRHPVREVRRQVMEHLRSTLQCAADPAMRLAFELIAGRYCPQLMVYDVPHDLRYGHTREAVDFRQAVALAESAHIGAAVALGYERLIKLLNDTLAQSMTHDEQLAITVLRREPTLHFAMCRGKIPVTDTADVTPENVMAALHYLIDLEEQKASAMTTLVQLPPDRKQMALQQLSDHHPLIEVNKRWPFSDAHIHEYFVPRFKTRGRNMHLSLLERYMTCGQDRAFSDSVLGFDSRGLGGCTLLKAFDDQFDAFQVKYNAALKVQLTHALNDLNPEQRSELLKSDHFLRVSFTVEGNEVPGFYGVLAFSTDPQTSGFYEIFCPSGTIRKIAPEGNAQLLYDYDDWAPTDAYRYVIGVPQLDQEAYLTGTPGALKATPTLKLSFTRDNPADLAEEQRVNQLCDKLVSSIFSQSLSQLRSAFRSPTPYEVYRDELVGRTEAIFKIIIPFYALYRDIENKKVNAWTVIFGALEALAFVVPFGKAAYSGFRASVTLGKIVVRGTSFGVSKFALTSMKTLYASKAFATTLGKGLISAANPYALAGLLFRGGLKGVAFIQRHLPGGKSLDNVVSLVQLRARLNPEAVYLSAPTSPFIQAKTISSGLASAPLVPFNPDFSWGNRKLSIAQQRLFHIDDVDLSNARQIDNTYQVAGLSYIKMQGNLFAVTRLPGSAFLNLYKGTLTGPAVRFNSAQRLWELADSGLAGGMETSAAAQLFQRRLNVPMDEVFNLNTPSSEPAYAISYGNYILPVVYDANLSTWRERILRRRPGTRSDVDITFGDPVWLDAAGKWHKGSVATLNTLKASLPPARKHVSFNLPQLPQLPVNPVAIPNQIHYIWVGTQAPGNHLINMIAHNLRHSSDFTSTLHLDVSDDLFAQIKLTCSLYAPQLQLSKIRDEAFFQVFKNSPDAEQYTTIVEAPHKTWSAASDVIRFPLINHYGGLYLDLDDALIVPLMAGTLNAAPNDLLLGGVIQEKALGFEGYNTSHFASHPNNPLLSAISAEMRKRFLANRGFYTQPKPVLNPALTGEALVKNQAEYKRYHQTYFQLTGPTLMNDVLIDKVPAVYRTVFQLMPKHSTFQTLGIYDPVHHKQAIDCTNHYFPFASKYPIEVGNEHSWV